MDKRLLQSFVAVVDHLHFGRAAQQLNILPAVIGRNVRLLEDEVGVRLFDRTTRRVSLTRGGEVMAEEARRLLRELDSAFARVREAAGSQADILRIGAIDSAATGLVPHVVRELRGRLPGVEVVIVEDKTLKLLPKLLSGALDAAFVRPPVHAVSGIAFDHLIDEAIIVALPEGHHLADRADLTIDAIADLPLIVPSPRTRPHSYHLTFDLFHAAGRKPVIAQQAEEKHTIVTLVGAGLGGALVPYWTSRMRVDGVVYRPLLDADGRPIRRLPLALATAGFADSPNGALLRQLLRDRIDEFAR